MSFTLRFIQSCMGACIALFFTLVALDNCLDYESNWAFVQHVLSMDTTYKSTAVMSRAIDNPLMQKAAYFFIICWESMTAVMCWLGCMILFAKINRTQSEFNEAKMFSFIGLFLGFLLYMVGFMIIASEWFDMWQSPHWNGQSTAGLFVSLIMFIMIFLKSDSPR
jgi:predicted small integral membrane protein